MNRRTIEHKTKHKTQIEAANVLMSGNEAAAFGVLGSALVLDIGSSLPKTDGNFMEMPSKTPQNFRQFSKRADEEDNAAQRAFQVVWTRVTPCSLLSSDLPTRGTSKLTNKLASKQQAPRKS